MAQTGHKHWVGGTNFSQHFVQNEDPTVQVVVRAGVVYVLPADYTMFDQLFDAEARTDQMGEALVSRLGRVVTMVGEPMARRLVVIDNTVTPPVLVQLPDEEGIFRLSEDNALKPRLSDVTQGELDG